MIDSTVPTHDDVRRAHRAREERKNANAHVTRLGDGRGYHVAGTHGGGIVSLAEAQSAARERIAAEAVTASEQSVNAEAATLRRLVICLQGLQRLAKCDNAARQIDIIYEGLGFALEVVEGLQGVPRTQEPQPAALPLTDPEERSVLDVALKAAKNAYENPRIIGIEVAARLATLAVLRKRLLGEHSGNAS